MIDAITNSNKLANNENYDDANKLKNSCNLKIADDCDHTKSENELTHEECKSNDDLDIANQLCEEIGNGCLFPANNPVRVKSSLELEFLEDQFTKDPSWSRKTVQYCKKALNLRTDQVYKWGYDKKKRMKQLNKNQDKSSSQISILAQQAAMQEIAQCVDLNLYVQSLLDISENLLSSLNSISSSLEIELPMDDKVTKENGIKW